ncbi:MAG: hypothetical protein WBQ94_29610, partial [Terracidiphilus sp.]
PTYRTLFIWVFLPVGFGCLLSTATAAYRNGAPFYNAWPWSHTRILRLRAPPAWSGELTGTDATRRKLRYSAGAVRMEFQSINADNRN